MSQVQASGSRTSIKALGAVRPEPRRSSAGSDLKVGSRDADYLAVDPGAAKRGRVRQAQLDLQKLGFFDAGEEATGGYFKKTAAAVQAFQAANGLPANGILDGETQARLRQLAGGKTTPVKKAPTPAAAIVGQGRQKDGHSIPRGEGRATTFANGHITYKGWSDAHNRQNKGLGAWGDRCAPTEYFCALPVSGKWWHNQKILVTNPANGQQVVVRLQDKGPGARTGVAIDLSPVAMEALGGKFNGSMGHVRFEFAPDDAPVGPVSRSGFRAEA